MKIRYFVWFDYVEDKLWWKHNVRTDEVEQVFRYHPKFFLVEKGNIEGEHIYNAL